jgi:RimJ/RimL family protein N-acetyltransferase
MYEHKNGLRLRKIEEEDLLLLKELKDESWFGTHRVSIVNMTDQLNWFKKITTDRDNLMLIAMESKKPIGLYKIADIDWINRHYNSAHDVFKEHRGYGYGYKVLEAGVDFGFEVLNMHRIDTEVLVNNIASHKTAIFAGFQLEGTRRDAVHKCGEWIDSNFYGLLYEEWFNLKRVKEYKGCCNLSYQPKDKK